MDRGNIVEYVRNLNNCRDNFPEFGDATSYLNILNTKLSFEKNAEQITYIADVVLHEDDGIWTFLKEIKGHKPPKLLLESIYSFIELLCQQKKRLSESQTRLFFDYCKDIIRSSTLSPEIKDYLGYKLFCLVIEHGSFQFFVQCGPSLVTCVHQLYFNLEKSKSTEKKQIYELIGNVAENHPDVFHHDQAFIIKVFRQISIELPKILKKQDGSGMTEVEGMIKCIGGLLRHLSDCAEKYTDTLYDCFKQIAERNSSKHVALRAVIQIIEKFFDVFAKLIKNDYVFWYRLLERNLVSNNKDNSLAAKKALHEFYPHIAKLLEKKSETNRTLLKFFLNALRDDILKEEKYKTEVALKNFIYFADACKIQEEANLLNEIFTLTMSLLDKYCLSFKELDNDSIFNLSNILHSTSRFLRHLSGEKCNEEYFQILANASVLSISAYAKAPEKMRYLILQPLLETIINVANLNELFLDSFLESIIYPGIVMSCSSMTEGNVDCLKQACEGDNEFTCDDLLTFRDYLPIWRTLLGNLQSHQDRQLIYSINLEGKIFDKIIDCTLRIIKKLDISMKEADESIDEEMECLILVEYDTVPSNPADFNIFINLVELFFELFDKWSNAEQKFQRWIPILLPTLMEYATYNDVKFGFYQMLAVIFKFIEHNNDFNTNEVKSFVLEELNHLSERPKTDSRACLRMVMSLPVCVVEEVLSDVVPALQLAFERGAEDLSLASEALTCLENWYLKVEKDKFKPVLSEVILFLKPFIQSKRFAGETISMTKHEKYLMKKVYSKIGSKSDRKYRRAYMQSEESDLDKLQKQLIKFLGKIDTELWIPVFTPDTFVDREPADLLQFTLHFQDTKVILLLDKFLPRLIDLACNSSDFNTRRDACEAFHSCVIVFLGENRGCYLEQQYPQYAASLFKKIISTVFRMSTDENTTIQQIFVPLAREMTHYYSKLQNEKIINDAFLEILFEAVTSKNDATYRKFIARLIKEFVSWSLKPGHNGENNIRMIVEHVCLFCLQPCSYKKLGAAITFNCISDELARNDRLRNTFWIELLLHFVRNLSTSSANDCNTAEVQVAIDKLVGTIRRHFQEFNKEGNYYLAVGRIPNWFTGRTLFEVQIWIFEQCCSSNELCRKKCMKILSKLLDGKDGRPELENFIGRRAIEKFKQNAKKLPNLNDPATKPECFVQNVISWLSILSANLDCYLWIIECKAKKLDSIFDHEDYELRNSVEYFLGFVVDKDLKTFVSDKFPFTPGQKKQFDLLKEELIYMILKVASFSENLSHSFIGEEKIFMKNFQSTFIKCLFEPHLVLPHKQSNSKLLDSLLGAILENLKNHEMVNNVLIDIYHHDYWKTFSDILDNPRQARTEHRSNPRVLFVLQKCGIIWPANEMNDLERTVRKIFYYIKQQNSNKAVVPDITIVSYFEDYLLFALKARYGNEFRKISDYIFCADELVSVSEKASFSHGLHFFNVFRTPILEYLIDHQDEFIYKCVNNLNLDAMKMLLAYLEFASIKKKKDCSSILEHWNTLKNSETRSNIDLSDLLKLLDFSIREMDMSKVENLSPVYDWLLEYLRSANAKVEIVHQILELLPAFMGFEFCSRFDSKLREVLQDLRRQQIDSKIKAEGLVVYNKLLNGLAKTGNRILFETVVQIAIDKDTPFQDNISATLEKLMNRSSEQQLKLLDIPWDMFKNTNNEIKLRLGSLELFLIPMMYLINELATVEEFYVQKMKSIHADLLLKIENGNKGAADLATLIGAVIMLELYYKIMPNTDNYRIKAVVFAENENGSLNSKFAKIALGILRNEKIPVSDANDDFPFKLRSHALNALIVVIRTAINSYETAQKWGKIIFDNKNMWCNIIKLEPQIKLTMTLEQIRTRHKEVIKKRREIKESSGLASIATQYATLSSLAPEVSKYDVNHFTVRTSRSEVLVDDVELYNEEREIDVLNNHVSMNALCNFVRFLEEKKFLIEDYDEEVPQFPEWMAKLLDALKWFMNRPKKFDDSIAHQNCVLYILKFITNCETAFRPFAKYWFSTLMECLCKLNQMNYVITDVVLMLLQWRDRVVPENRISASNLFKMFTLKVTKHQTSSRNYLMEMMKAMIQVWNPYFDVPFKELESFTTSKDKEECAVGLNISEYFLQCSKSPYDDSNRAIILNNFMEKLTDQKLRWHNKQVATILGLVLKTACKAGDGTLDHYYEQLKSKMVDRMKILINSPVKTVDSFCLMEHLIVHYPPILEDFSYHFLQRFNNLQGSYKRNCLKVLTNNVSHVPDDAFGSLFSCNFESALKTSDHDLSEQALLLMKSFLSEDRIRVRIEDLSKIIEDVRRLSTHETSQCRKAAYDVASCIYDKYRNESDEKAKELVYICKDILLAGLLDTDAELQDEIYKSWEKRSNLENSVTSRFLSIIKTMYHPQHEAQFISYAVDFLLQACASTEDYDSELFSHSLQPCDFTPYQIISTRSKKLSSLTPCFRNSIQHQLASLGSSQQAVGTLTLQINRTPGSSQSTINLSRSTLGAKSMRMYTPGSYHPLKYISPVPTNSKTDSTETNKPFDSVGKALDRLKKRIIGNTQEASYIHARRNAKLNEETCQILANQADKRDRKMDLKRQYRKGDFPDIQIKRSDLIKPLQALAKRDPIIAKLLFSNIFLNVVNKMKEKQDYLKNIDEAFNAILQCTEQYGSICLETIFEIAYSLPTLLNLEIKSVVIASNMNNLLSLRALLLENSLIYGENDCGPSAPKRARIENSPENDSLWIHLAEVYRSLDRYDVVNGIFKDKIQNSYCQLLKKGLEMETIGDWEGAYEIYENEVDKLTGMNDTSQDQRFILDAYYKCAAYLSKWDEMRQKIDTKFSTVENILQDNWHKECTLPWYFLSQAYETVKTPSLKVEFQKNFHEEVLEMDKNNDTLFLDLLAEPSSMLFFVYGNQNKSRNLIVRSLDLILKEFNFSDSSLETFLKLQTLSEIDIMLSVFNDDQYKTLYNIEEMLGIWKRCEPNKDHSVWWDRRLLYRHHFAKKYSSALENTMDETGFDLCQSLNDYQFYSKLQFCEKALDRQNYNLACQYTADAEETAKDNISDEWKFMRSLNLCRIYTFRADKKDSIRMIQLATEEMKLINEINGKCEFKTSMAVSNLLKVIKKKFNVWPSNAITSLLENFPEKFDERVPLFQRINTLIAENYNTACETAKRKEFSDVQISSAYLALAKHCREVSNETSAENALEVDLQIANSILSAMKYNSKEAYQLFPVLLDLRSVEIEEFEEFFVKQCEKVEEWKFLSWINQLLVYIQHGKVSLIGDLVKRMARKYPKAFHFPFLLSRNVSKTDNNEVVQEIENSLQPLDDIKEFVKALSFVWRPDEKWKLYKRELEKSLDTDDPDTVCQKFARVQKEIQEYGGSYWPDVDFLSDRTRLRSGLSGDKNHVKEKLQGYLKKVESKMFADKSPELSSYSKILYDFINTRNASIEIPGQYDGFSLPRVERHVKIFGFQSKVVKMHSLKSPMKITVLGDDAKEYSFLVKMNEDVRQDQRIQQIFHIVNQALTSKFHLYSKHLILNTFGVYPLRSDLGIIEWVEDSVPLKQFPNIGLTRDKKTKIEENLANLRKEYELNEILNKNVCGKDFESYNLAVRNYISDEKRKRNMINAFRNTVQKIPEDIYKKALMLLTTTPHLFWRLRNQFMANYSAMCIASWILGIGDRHLDNILVSLKSGTCIGIDFGLAFGTGTDFLPVPELIPFRMTPHITSIMAPFDLTGLIRETMIEVLQTLRENDYVFLATMPVFILDPSIDWRNAARKLFPQADTQNNQDESYFENKIKNVKLKLEGCHPSTITINELRVNPQIKHCSYYENLVTEATGSVIDSHKLTTEEQVDCLLKIATHDGVLATSFSGLETWI